MKKQSFRTLLLYLMEENQMSCKKLAKLTKRTTGNINKYLTGKSHWPRKNTLKTMLSVLDINLLDSYRFEQVLRFVRNNEHLDKNTVEFSSKFKNLLELCEKNISELSSATSIPVYLLRDYLMTSCHPTRTSVVRLTKYFQLANDYFYSTDKDSREKDTQLYTDCKNNPIKNEVKSRIIAIQRFPETFMFILELKKVFDLSFTYFGKVCRKLTKANIYHTRINEQDFEFFLQRAKINKAQFFEVQRIVRASQHYDLKLNKFDTKLKLLLEDRQLKVARLAYKARIPTELIKLWLAGEALPSKASVKRIADVLQFDKQYFYEESINFKLYGYATTDPCFAEIPIIEEEDEPVITTNAYCSDFFSDDDNVEQHSDVVDKNIEVKKEDDKRTAKVYQNFNDLCKKICPEQISVKLEDNIYTFYCDEDYKEMCADHIYAAAIKLIFDTATKQGLTFNTTLRIILAELNKNKDLYKTNKER